MSIYTEDRETFERQMFSTPPHAARLAERAGRFVGRLSNKDKDALLRVALDQFWETRDQINTTQDLLSLWIEALQYSARRRPRWRCWWSGRDEWIKSSRLENQS